MRAGSRSTKFAIFGLVWSLVVGILGLLGLRIIQVLDSSGHPTSFPTETLFFWGVVESLLVLAFLCFRRNQKGFKILILAILASTVGTTVLAIRPAMGWTSDFLPFTLWFEAIWLGPWILVFSS